MSKSIFVAPDKSVLRVTLAQNNQDVDIIVNERPIAWLSAADGKLYLTQVVSQENEAPGLAYTDKGSIVVVQPS